MTGIYSKELILISDDSEGHSASLLNLKSTISDDDFGFRMSSFQISADTIPTNSTHGVFIDETVHHARAYISFHDESRVFFLCGSI